MGFGNKYPQSINADLDLHHHKLSEALPLLEGFLSESEEKGFQYVRIITGKGLHSPDGKSTIKEAVKDWLHTHGYHFRYAKQSQGGEGALVVALF